MTVADTLLGHLYGRPASRHKSSPPLSVEDAVMEDFDRVIDNKQATEVEKYDAFRLALRRLIAEGKVEQRAMWCNFATEFEDSLWDIDGN